MSRVFEAMRRLNSVAVETPAAPAEVLENFVLEAPRPNPEQASESASPKATSWNEPGPATANPADRRPARENKREKIARHFSDLLHEIAVDEQEQDY